ncbi:myelin-oligodendrocyte glycoprotein-like, partial [Oryctolagus cuniculus]|uniref:myelin-oligodendrocyte glycoprotein-like n=1 Tax=Oryctolagus cuniculus TaxID=9986 RepID=UPI00387911B8
DVQSAGVSVALKFLELLNVRPCRKSQLSQLGRRRSRGHPGHHWRLKSCRKQEVVRPPGSEDRGHGCRPSLLCSLPSLLLLAQLPTWGSADEFQVIGPSYPMVAVLGGDATLPCSLFPPMNAEDMEMRWFHTKISEVVFVYQNGQKKNKKQMPQYAGGTSLVQIS